MDRLDIGTQVLPGIEIRDNKNGFKVIRLHYTANPYKRSLKWRDKTRQGMPEDKWEQEYEINFNVLHGKRFYADFEYEKHSRILKPDSNLTILRGWDFGWHYPACVWAQIDLNDRLRVLREEMGKDVALINFAKKILKISSEEFSGHKFRDFCDPSGKRTTETGEKSSVDILKSLGIRAAMKKTEREYGFNILRSLLTKEVVLPSSEKSPAFLIDRKCNILIDGFMGGYHYEEVADGKEQKKDPDGGGYYEHLQDALRYILICLFKPDGSVFHNIRPFYKVRKTANELTGY